MQEGTPAQVTRSKGSRETFESYDGKFVFFAKLQTSGIFKMPVEGSEETQVLRQGGLNLWAVARDGICFLEWKRRVSSLDAVLQFPRPPPNDVIRISASDESGHGRLGALRVADGRWILYTQVDQAVTGVNGDHWLWETVLRRPQRRSKVSGTASLFV